MDNQQDQQQTFNLEGSVPFGSTGRITNAMPTPESDDDSRRIWDSILDFPGVRTWRSLRDIVFLVTTLPLGLAAFIVILFGVVLGLSLSWLMIGFPILVWAIGLTLRYASHERARIKALLDIDLGEPRYPTNTGENVFRHLVHVLRSPQVRNDLIYMALLFPIGIIEFVLLTVPLEFLFAPLTHLAIGSLSPLTLLGMEIGSRFEAFGFAALGLVLIIPTLLLANIASRLHAAFARKMLMRR